MFYICQIKLAPVIWILHFWCVPDNEAILQDVFTDNTNMACPPILETIQNGFINRIVAYSFNSLNGSYQMNGFIKSVDIPPSNLPTNSFNPTNGIGFIYGNDRNNGNNTLLISVPKGKYTEIGSYDIIITMAYDIPYGYLYLPVFDMNGLSYIRYYSRNSNSSSNSWRIYNARYPVQNGFNFMISGSDLVRFDDVCIFQVCQEDTQFDDVVGKCTDACYYKNCYSSNYCKVVNGIAICSCPTFYILDSDGSTCLINPCILKKCDYICKVVLGKAVCSCPTGMILSSYNNTCVLDPCYYKNCINSNFCYVVFDNAVCSCPVGYKLQTDGKTCFQDPCYYKNCYSSNYCNLVSGSAVCSCPIGYKLQIDGSTCLQDPCYNKMCYNLSYCNVVSGNAVCSCPTGLRLQSDNITCSQDPCYYKTCYNSSYCNVVSGNAMCSCPIGFKLQSDGSTCTQDFCYDKNCYNSSYCNVVSNSAVCSCPVGYKLQPDGSTCLVTSPSSPPLEPQTNKATVIILAVLVPVLFLLVSILIFVAVCLKKKLKSKQPMQNPFLQIVENNKIANEVIGDDWEVFPENFTMVKKIGEGAYGTVFVAKIDAKILAKTMYAIQSRASLPDINADSTSNVAVKLLKDVASQQEINDFKEEINLMKSIGCHQNIVNMFGCSTVKNPLCLIVEYMENGDLLQFLRNRRTKLRCSNVNGQQNVRFIYANCHQFIERTGISEKSKISRQGLSSDEIPLDDVETITPDDLISFAWQVASGMEFLSKVKLVHRDLAARNILVGAKKNVKISDFGLSRKIHYEMQYIGSKVRRMPVKWMSIEALLDQVFTSYSDVWAYGIVLFEIVTLGGTPYPTLTNRELLSFLKTGCRMDQPENCSSVVYNIMLNCWNKDPLQRPTFTELRKQLEEIISQGGRYFSFDIDEENPYYNVPSFNSIQSETAIDL
ncbi:receptor tyrosine-protein kinase let-23-like [Hydra vulgaris]|uniref:Receptor tyrosine-protein kinase let-23-like n=1 Tax=Hydra vulgaris TaxID=6087 RepID=A0ABM4CSN2_HYDVU